MTKDDLIFDDAEFIDLGEASELTEGFGAPEGEGTLQSHEE